MQPAEPEPEAALEMLRRSYEAGPLNENEYAEKVTVYADMLRDQLADLGVDVDALDAQIDQRLRDAEEAGELSSHDVQTWLPTAANEFDLASEDPWADFRLGPIGPAPS